MSVTEVREAGGPTTEMTAQMGKRKWIPNILRAVDGQC